MTINAQNCRNFEPSMFVVNHALGEKLSPVVAQLLAPVNMASLHYWDMTKETATELHYHDYDEYWAWAKGRTVVTIRLPDGRQEKFEVCKGSVVYCVRGIEHGHQPKENWACYEWTGIAEKDARMGHLYRKT